MKQRTRISNQVIVSGFILCLLANSLPAVPWDNGIVKVSADTRCLVHENGKPFFMMGDTVWAKVVRLGREDVILFLDNLQGKWTTKIVHWKQDMDSKGAFQMTHVKNLWESRSLAGRMPAEDILAKPLSDARQLVVIKGKGYAIVYAPFGDDIVVKLGSLGFEVTVLTRVPLQHQSVHLNSIPWFPSSAPAPHLPSPGAGSCSVTVRVQMY